MPPRKPSPPSVVSNLFSAEVIIAVVTTIFTPVAQRTVLVAGTRDGDGESGTGGTESEGAAERDGEAVS